MNDDEMIDDITRLAGINKDSNLPRAVVLMQHNNDVDTAFKNLVDKLKEIDCSVGQNWTEININGFKYWATGIIHDKPRTP